MSPVGHSLVGLSFAAFALPFVSSRKWKLFVTCIFVALASVPDWPIQHWGHDRYEISHSIYVNIVIICVVISLWYCLPRLKSSIPFWYLPLGAGTWLSHLILDSFYSHGLGVAIYWPFSNARLNCPLPWFNTLDLSQSAFSQHNLSVYAIEFTAFLPVLVIAIAMAVVIRRWSRGIH